MDETVPAVGASIETPPLVWSDSHTTIRETVSSKFISSIWDCGDVEKGDCVSMRQYSTVIVVLPPYLYTNPVLFPQQTRQLPVDMRYSSRTIVSQWADHASPGAGG